MYTVHVAVGSDFYLTVSCWCAESVVPKETHVRRRNEVCESIRADICTMFPSEFAVYSMCMCVYSIHCTCMYMHVYGNQLLQG